MSTALWTLRSPIPTGFKAVCTGVAANQSMSLETASCFVVNDVSKPGVRITWLALLKGVFQLKFNKFSKI